ncbi:hypothetical protein HKX48_003756 [Thoreauomyces humboldtii]|nr:hypothetical protein HKX48_003756 [Thoreauomyces humboldtii]
MPDATPTSKNTLSRWFFKLDSSKTREDVDSSAQPSPRRTSFIIDVPLSVPRKSKHKATRSAPSSQASKPSLGQISNGDLAVEHYTPTLTKPKRRPLGHAGDKRTVQAPSAGTTKKQMRLDFFSGAKDSPHAHVSRKDGGSTSTSAELVQAPTSTKGAAASSTSSIPLKAPVLQSKGSLPGKASKKILEDLSDEVVLISKPLPDFDPVPEQGCRPEADQTWRKITAEESLELSAVAEFSKTFWQFMSGPEKDLSWFDLLLFEGYLYDVSGGQLISLYQILVNFLNPEIAATALSVQHHVAVILRGKLGVKDQTSANVFSESAFERIPPTTHLQALTSLLEEVQRSEDFRAELKLALDHQQDIRTERRTAAATKKEFQEKLKAQEEQLAELTTKVNDVQAELDALLQSGDEGDGAGAGVRSRAEERNQARDRRARRDKIVRSTKDRRAAIGREHSTLVDLLNTTEREYKDFTVNATETMWTSRNAEFESLVRGNPDRLLGYDRFGRIYWWIVVSTAAPSEIKANTETPITADGARPSVDCYGVIVETVTYQYTDPAARPDPKGKGKAPLASPSADPSYYTPADNEAKRSMDIGRNSKWHYISSLAGLQTLYAKCNDRGARESQLKKNLKTKLENHGVVLTRGWKNGQAEKAADQAMRAVQAFGAWMTERGNDLTEPSGPFDNKSDSVEALDRLISGDLYEPSSLGSGTKDIVGTKAMLRRLRAQWEKQLTTRLEEGGDATVDASLPDWVDTVQTVSDVSAWCEAATMVIRGVNAARAARKRKRGMEAPSAPKRKKPTQPSSTKGPSRELRALQAAVSTRDTRASRRRASLDEGDHSEEDENTDPANTTTTRSGRRIKKASPRLNISDRDFDELFDDGAPLRTTRAGLRAKARHVEGPPVGVGLRTRAAAQGGNQAVGRPRRVNSDSESEEEELASSDDQEEDDEQHDEASDARSRTTENAEEEDSHGNTSAESESEDELLRAE